VPQRLQLSRKKGWRLPPGAIACARPGPWGNPFILLREERRERVVGLYRLSLVRRPALLARARRELRGHDLACWCPLDVPCHVDVLLELVNR
jgi:hypothetical protein